MLMNLVIHNSMPIPHKYLTLHVSVNINFHADLNDISSAHSMMDMIQFDVATTTAHYQPASSPALPCCVSDCSMTQTCSITAATCTSTATSTAQTVILEIPSNSEGKICHMNPSRNYRFIYVIARFNAHNALQRAPVSLNFLPCHGQSQESSNKTLLLKSMSTKQFSCSGS